MGKKRTTVNAIGFIMATKQPSKNCLILYTDPTTHGIYLINKQWQTANSEKLTCIHKLNVLRQYFLTESQKRTSQLKYDVVYLETHKSHKQTHSQTGRQAKR